MIIALNPKVVVYTMLSIIALLASMHISQLAYYFHINDSDIFDFVEILDFDYEANLPSFYSAAAIIFCALLLLVISVLKKQENAPYKYHWLGLTIIFVFLGIDEAIALHEDIGDLVEAQQWFEATGFLYFAWVAPYGILLLLFVASYLKFVFALPRSTMILFITAGTIFIGGAVGIEIFSAREADVNGTETVLYSTLYTIEELCEMTGIVIFCYALLRYIEVQYTEVTFRIQTEAK